MTDTFSQCRVNFEDKMCTETTIFYTFYTEYIFLVFDIIFPDWHKIPWLFRKIFEFSDWKNFSQFPMFSSPRARPANCHRHDAKYPIPLNFNNCHVEISGNLNVQLKWDNSEGFELPIFHRIRVHFLMVKAICWWRAQLLPTKPVLNVIFGRHLLFFMKWNQKYISVVS